MHPRLMRLALTGVLLLVTTMLLTAQERDRAKVPDSFKWNLADIYPDQAAWRARKDAITAELPALRTSRGHARRVRRDAGRRARADVAARQGAVAPLRLRQHAGRPGHARVRAAGHAAGDAAAVRRTSARRRRSSSPRCCASAARRSSRSSGSEPRLKPYAFYLRDIVRRAAHTLTDPEEKLLADAGPLAGSASNIYGILSNADFPYPDHHAQRRQDREGRSGRLLGAAHVAQPARIARRR